VAVALLNDANRPDKTRNAGWTAFGGYRLQFRENESERIVHAGGLTYRRGRLQTRRLNPAGFSLALLRAAQC
jgi:hypothetical protein